MNKKIIDQAAKYEWLLLGCEVTRFNHGFDKSTITESMGGGEE